MQPAPENVVKVVGARDVLEELRRDVMADPELGKGTVGGVTEMRSRQFGAEEIIFAVVIHFPTGIAAHFVYDWLKSWRERKGKNVRVEEAPGH
jgi:hypothetical protein